MGLHLCICRPAFSTAHSSRALVATGPQHILPAALLNLWPGLPCCSAACTVPSHRAGLQRRRSLLCPNEGLHSRRDAATVLAQGCRQALGGRPGEQLTQAVHAACSRAGPRTSLPLQQAPVAVGSPGPPTQSRFPTPIYLRSSGSGPPDSRSADQTATGPPRLPRAGTGHAGGGNLPAQPAGGAAERRSVGGARAGAATGPAPTRAPRRLLPARCRTGRHLV